MSKCYAVWEVTWQNVHYYYKQSVQVQGHTAVVVFLPLCMSHPDITIMVGCKTASCSFVLRSFCSSFKYKYAFHSVIWKWYDVAYLLDVCLSGSLL